jgi:hypothetical protein
MTVIYVCNVMTVIYVCNVMTIIWFLFFYVVYVDANVNILRSIVVYFLVDFIFIKILFYIADICWERQY